VSVAIVDYGSGNLHSAAKAFERAARESGHDQPILVTRDPDVVRRAERVVLPGVGAFADCRRGLDAVPGMVEALHETVRGKGRPFLGICVGMQMLFEHGEEGDTPGLGLLAGRVPRFPAARMAGLKVPHMGWNEVRQAKPHALWAGIPSGERFYFVHSYYPAPADPGVVAATCDYGVAFTCAIARDNIFAVQFHPEKSQAAGLRLLSNFVQWRP